MWTENNYKIDFVLNKKNVKNNDGRIEAEILGRPQSLTNQGQLYEPCQEPAKQNFEVLCSLQLSKNNETNILFRDSNKK